MGTPCNARALPRHVMVERPAKADSGLAATRQGGVAARRRLGALPPRSSRSPVAPRFGGWTMGRARIDRRGLRSTEPRPGINRATSRRQRRGRAPPPPHARSQASGVRGAARRLVPKHHPAGERRPGRDQRHDPPEQPTTIDRCEITAGRHGEVAHSGGGLTGGGRRRERATRHVGPVEPARWPRPGSRGCARRRDRCSVADQRIPGSRRCSIRAGGAMIRRKRGRVASPGAGLANR